MADIFDYLKWRGDLPVSQAPFNAVDALILSTLSYVAFDGILPPYPDAGVELKDAAKAFLSLPRQREQVRVKADYDLLPAAADTVRFGSLRLTNYRSVLDVFYNEQVAGQPGRST